MNVLQLATQLVGFLAAGRGEHSAPAQEAYARPAPRHVRNGESHAMVAMHLPPANARMIGELSTVDLGARLAVAHREVTAALDRVALQQAAAAESHAALKRAREAEYRTASRGELFRASRDAT